MLFFHPTMFIISSRMITQILQTWPGTIDQNNYKTIPFKKIDQPNGWLGNMSKHALRVPSVPRGVLYQTAEHYFQCERFKDLAIRQAILSKNSPMSCKMIARRHRAHMTIAPRSLADLALMRRTIRLKLENHPNLQAQLLALPEDGIIIEDASARHGKSAGFWGMRLQGDIWTGENWLGRLWMELRQKLANPGVNSDKACTPKLA
jgi:ribA/ribD-fused uncharacterized protein